MLTITSFSGSLEDSGSSGSFGNFGNFGAGTGTITTDQQFYAGLVTLVFHHTSGDFGFLGVDDLNVDQQLVPEPVGLAAVVVGAMPAVTRRRPRA